jgi:hypothetical protein
MGVFELDWLLTSGSSENSSKTLSPCQSVISSDCAIKVLQEEGRKATKGSKCGSSRSATKGVLGNIHDKEEQSIL